MGIMVTKSGFAVSEEIGQPMDSSQASLSMGFPRQEYWSGLPFPPLGIFSDSGIELDSLAISCIGRRVLYHLGSPV